MKNILKISTAALLASAVSASAASLIDFTAEPVMLSGSIGSNGWVVTGSPQDPTAPNVGAPLAPGPIGGLAGDNDGLGIKGAEVSGFNPPQFITVTFDKKVKLVGSYYLNLFEAQNGLSEEIVRIVVDLADGTNPMNSAVNHSVDAAEVYQQNFGFKYDNSKTLAGTSFSFFIRAGDNDAVGAADFSLAALEVEAIPLPAGVLLMGTALGGLGLMMRRRKKS